MGFRRRAGVGTVVTWLVASVALGVEVAGAPDGVSTGEMFGVLAAFVIVVAAAAVAALVKSLRVSTPQSRSQQQRDDALTLTRIEARLSALAHVPGELRELRKDVADVRDRVSRIEGAMAAASASE